MSVMGEENLQLMLLKKYFQLTLMIVHLHLVLMHHGEQGKHLL